MSYAKGYPGTNMAYEPFADMPELSTESAYSTNKRESEELKQKSKEWFLHRWDKFTGSEIGDLMKRGRGKNEEWGETAKGIILKKVAYAQMTDEGREMQSEIEMSKDFVQTRWGNTYEPEARNAYAELTGLNVVETGFMVNPKIPYNGGSFDGEVWKGKEQIDVTSKDSMGIQSYIYVDNKRIGIIEIKCPYDPVKHDKNASLAIDGLDQSHEYYAQIQNNINVAGVDWCDFISYDPRRKPEHRLVVIRVNRDDFFIEGMVDRIHKAQRIKLGVLDGKSINEMCKLVEQE